MKNWKNAVLCGMIFEPIMDFKMDVINQSS